MSSIRYRGFSDEALQEMLTAHVEALSLGLNSVTLNGETTDYSDPAKMEAVIVSIESEIARRERVAAGRKPRPWTFQIGLPGGKRYL